MKSIMFILIFVLCAFTEGFSQDHFNPIYYFNSGLSFPMEPNDFSKYWKKGFNLGSGIEHAINSDVAAQVYFEYNTMPVNKKKLHLDNLSVLGGRVSTYTLSFNLKAGQVNPDNNIGFYGIIGGGFFRGDQSGLAPGNVSVLVSTENCFSGHLGFGILRKLTPRYGVFIETKYALALNKGKNIQYVPVKLGVMFQQSDLE